MRFSYHLSPFGDLIMVCVPRKYQFRLEEVEPFRYRAMDAYKAVTAIAIRESRLKEIKTEIFNNKKLKVGEKEISV